MKTYLPWIIIACLIIGYFVFDGCRDKPETVIVNTPEVKGSFPAVVNPASVPAPEKVYVYKYIDRVTRDTVEIVTENPVNETLLAYYNNATQREKDSLHADAIGIREYDIPQEDSLLKTDNYIKAQGTVLEFKQSYTIKPQKVAVKKKETVFRMLAGFEVGNTLQIDNPVAKANLMLQNKKGNILTVGYDIDKRIWVGYNFSIFNIKK